MAFTEENGSHTAVINTEATLNATDPETTDCILTVCVDTAAMVAGDVLEVRVYEKCRTADTQREMELFTLAGVQGRPLFMSPPFHVLHGWKVTLKQTAGTGRAFPWSLRKVT